MRQLIVILSVTGILAACSAGPPSGPASAYDQGCRGGMLDGGVGNNYVPFRDQQLYATDTNYRQNWDAGYTTCFDRAISEPRRR